jgi:preprotein translocase subunit SecE
MNREMRRLSEREERRSKKQQGGGRGGGRPPRSGGGGGGGGRGGGKSEGKSIWARLGQFLREVRTELERVSWPTRQQMVAFTTVTLITTTVLTLVVFGMDLGFRRGVLTFIRALT